MIRLSYAAHFEPFACGPQRRTTEYGLFRSSPKAPNCTHVRNPFPRAEVEL